MASLFPEVLTAVKFNDFDLLVTTMGNHFGGDLPACYQWGADFNRITTNHQDLVELDSFACGHFNLFQFEGFTLNNAVLLATALYYCVHIVLRLISLLAFTTNPFKSRGQSQAQTVELTRDSCEWAQHRPEGGDFTQIRLPEQGLIFYKNNELRTA
jgi:hypothetical protein